MKALLGILVLSQLAWSEVRIQEVCYDPEGADSGLEWVELVNTGAGPVQLQGWLIDLSGPNLEFPELELASGQTLVIHSNALVEQSPTDVEFWFQGANMGNTHGFVGLWMPGGQQEENLVDYMEYGQAGHSWEGQAIARGIWPEDGWLPDVESGQSLHRNGAGYGPDTWEVEENPFPGVLVTSMIDVEPSLPATMKILGVHPNPFNPMTTLRFQLSRSGLTEVRVYNLLGELMEQVLKRNLPAGTHQLRLDLSRHCSGCYLVELRSGDQRDLRRVLLLE